MANGNTQRQQNHRNNGDGARSAQTSGWERPIAAGEVVHKTPVPTPPPAPARVAEPMNLRALDMAPPPYSPLPHNSSGTCHSRGPGQEVHQAAMPATPAEERHPWPCRVKKRWRRPRGRKRQYRAPRADFQTSTEAAGGRGTQNVCYGAICWKTKERPLPCNLLCYQSQAKRLLNVLAEEQFHQTSRRTIVTLDHRSTITLLQ